MSVEVKQKSFMLPQPTLTAIQKASEVLGLTDLKALSVAMSKAALESLERNDAFGEKVRTIYAEYATPAKAIKNRSGTSSRLPLDDLIPIKHVEPPDSNPAAPPDPYYLNEVYGANQLPRALKRYKKPLLLQAAEIVSLRNPSAKLGSKPTVDTIITFIVRYVTTP